jgi:hypothetical protein
MPPALLVLSSHGGIRQEKSHQKTKRNSRILPLSAAVANGAPGRMIFPPALNCWTAYADESDISVGAQLPFTARKPGVTCGGVRGFRSMSKIINRRQFGLGSLALGTSLVSGRGQAAQRGLPPRGLPARGLTAAVSPSEPVVPGTGIRVARTGDDFEVEGWTWYPQEPKSSWDIDKKMRVPGGVSHNYQWAEGGKRGQPDTVRRVPTPEGGLEGSTGSMLIQTLESGVPDRKSGRQHQDDLLNNVAGTVGRTIPVSWSPNCVCRIYIAPPQRWEERNGASFGYRVGCTGFGKKSDNEEYWPGIFLHMERGLKDGERTYGMRCWVRADAYGRDIPEKIFPAGSWITLGMSCTEDGRCHFYAREGIEDLTAEDNIGSYWCYGYRARNFQTFFYNVINIDDGRSVSTPWIIDDAFLFAATPPADKVRGVAPAEPPEPTGDTSAAPEAAAEQTETR